MRLRGSEVFARCDESGKPLAAARGRVEIRYKAGGKAYHANKGNLESIPGAKLESDFDAGSGKSSGTKTRKKKTASKPAKSAPEGNEIIAYCDGACSGNPGPAGLGAILISSDGRKELSEYLGRGTNNIAELTAIMRVLQEAEPGRKLEIFTDSKYSIDMLTKNWKAKKNAELIDALRLLYKAHGDVELIHVRGHQGIELNERADELAVQAVQDKVDTGWVEC